MLHVDEDDNGSIGEGVPASEPKKTSGQNAPAKSVKNETAMAAAMPSALISQKSVVPAAPSKPTPVATAKVPATTIQLKTTMNPQTSILARLRSGNSAPLSATPAADALKKFIESINSVLQAKDSGYGIDIVPINANESATRLFASAVVLTVRLADKPDAGVSYHAMLLGDTAEQLPVQQLTLGGNAIVEVQRVVGDAYDDEYRAVIQATLQAAYPNMPVFETEAEVIPAGYNYKDLNLVQKTLANALTACGTILNTNVKADFEDLELPKLLENGRIDSVAKLSYGQPNGSDSVGQPVRQDVVVSYSLVTGQPQAKRNVIQSLNSGQVNTEVFKIGGFIDLMWWENEQMAGAQQNQFASPYANAAPVTNQMPYKYLPRFVITDTSSNDLATLPGTLWGLTAVNILKRQNNWMGAFARSAGLDANHHDIGAIGIEVNHGRDPSGYGKPFDETRSNTFTPHDLHQLLSAFVRPELVISIDVEECGSATWQNSVFVAAANSPKANQDIIDAANLLTGGHFGKYFADGEPVMVNDDNRIHLGHFTDNRGRTLDLREIDQLCVLNVLGSTNPEQGRAWSDTYTDLRFPWEQRQHERLKIIRQISAGAVVTGAARRMTFRNKFLDALAAGVYDAGLSIRPETPYMEIVSGSRGQADFLRDATGGLQNSGQVFNRNMPSSAGPSNSLNGGFGRWR